MAIRNFAYLDADKLRSLSSQVFEGVIEEMIRESSEEKTDTEQQAAGFASGRLLGDIFSTKASTAERAFLDDHAYSLFEDKLVKDGTLVDGSSSMSLTLGSFIKIVGSLSINDHVHSANILRNFNALGQAFWRVTNDPFPMEAGANATKPAADNKVKDGAAKAGMQFHSKTVEASVDILEFGYGDLIEFNLSSGGRIFSSPVKREFLRERENMLVKKYSRMPKQDFVIVGIITQIGGEQDAQQHVGDVANAPSMKEAMRTLSQHANIFEKAFNEPAHDEFIVDPIAIYNEI